MRCGDPESWEIPNGTYRNNGLVGRDKMAAIKQRTVSATLTVSFLSFNKLATSLTIALTFSGGNSLGADILVINLLLIG
jgi:hypothetical protein